MLKEELSRFTPFNAQEEKDKEELCYLIENESNLYSRENTRYHFTASAWVLNQDHTKVLMCYHNLYHSWSWLGGHADGNKNLLEVAKKEVEEESGLHTIRVLSPSIFSLEILCVDGHKKNGEYVSSHMHLNITYLFECDESEPLKIKEDENSGLRWFPIEEAVEASSEVWFRENIYKKLNEKLKLAKLY